MKPLPLNVADFKTLRSSDCVYADKTDLIFRLLNTVNKYYFLSRPRRFGKSLLLSTMHELFNGERKLFEGLWIDRSGYDFKVYPVIHLDMTIASTVSIDEFKLDLISELKRIADNEAVETKNETILSTFSSLIVELSKKSTEQTSVVVLIDEYDNQITSNLSDISKADAFRNLLRDFYKILKSHEKFLKFVFITGVSKFTETSIFSGLNNLEDISLLDDYSTICGIEITQFEALFSSYLQKCDLATLEKIKNWYDGYSWNGISRVYNPYSIIKYFYYESFENFWVDTGTPKYLFDFIKSHPSEYIGQDTLEISRTQWRATSIDNLDLVTTLFMSGYLTVQERYRENEEIFYRLDLPNKEVRDSFNKYLLDYMLGVSFDSVHQTKRSLFRAVNDGDLLALETELSTLFSSIPYQLHVDTESYYNSIFFLLLKFYGFDIDAEVSMSAGRIDAVLKTRPSLKFPNGLIYVMKWKYEKCDVNAPEEEKQKALQVGINKAMNQLKFKGYSDLYRGSDSVVVEVAVALTARNRVKIFRA